jgi:hypothetical protein
MKDIIDALAQALTGSQRIETAETTQKWFMCVSDGQGGVQRYETSDVFQWLATGWPAWVQDDEGRHLTIATKARGKN